MDIRAVLAEVDEHHPSAFVIDAEAVTDTDMTAADEVAKLVDGLTSRDVTVVFARLGDPARESLESGGLDITGRDFGRVERAVEALSNP